MTLQFCHIELNSSSGERIWKTAAEVVEMQSQLRGQALRQAAFHGPSARRLVVPVRAEVRREGSIRQMAEQIVR